MEKKLGLLLACTVALGLTVCGGYGAVLIMNTLMKFLRVGRKKVFDWNLFPKYIMTLKQEKNFMQSRIPHWTLS